MFLYIRIWEASHINTDTNQKDSREYEMSEIFILYNLFTTEPQHYKLVISYNFISIEFSFLYVQKSVIYKCDQLFYLLF